jgi:hypothetical protein
MMPTQEWSQIWHNARLDVELLQATHVQHTYPRHFHEYYVLCVIEQGFQSFTHRDARHFTPPGSVIFIHRGAVHTGESTQECGSQMHIKACFHNPYLKTIVTILLSLVY